MSIHAFHVRRMSALGSSALMALLALGSMASAQDQPAQNQPAPDQPVQSQPAQPQPAPSPPPPAAPTPSAAAPATAAPAAPVRVGGGAGHLPQITVTAPPVRRPPRQVVRRTPPPPTVPPLTPAEQLTTKNNAFDQSRSNLYTTIGTTSDTISHDTIEALPQGTNAPVEKVLLQAPGVSQDFGGERSSPCPQRPRQCAIPHQWRHAARRRHRLRQHFRHRPDRQHVARHRRAAGRVRHAHGRPRRHHHPYRRVQQFRQRQPLRRQPRHHRTELRIWRHLRQPLPRDDRGSDRRQGAAIVVGELVLPGRAIFLQRPLPADHRGHRKPAADAQRHPRFLVAGKRLRLHVGLRRPVDAGEPDRRNRHQQFPNSQHPRRADQCRYSARVRSSTFNSAQLNENQFEHTQYGVLALQRSANGFDGQLSYFTRYNQSALHAGPGRRPAAQRHRLRHQPAILYQRYAGRRLVCGQRGAYASRRLHRQRRTGLGRQFIDRRALHGVRRHRQRTARDHH